ATPARTRRATSPRSPPSYLRRPGSSPFVKLRAREGTSRSAFIRASASWSGVLPSASTWTRSPVASWAIPRAMVCRPSERISTTSRARTGSSGFFSSSSLMQRRNMALPRAGRTLRVIGFDDVPWRHRRKATVGVVGAVCAGTRFEGMVYGTVRRDGWRATSALEALLLEGKFLPQIHLVLLDGIALGGFNVVDLPRLAHALQRPCI